MGEKPWTGYRCFVTVMAAVLMWVIIVTLLTRFDKQLYDRDTARVQPRNSEFAAAVSEFLSLYGTGEGVVWAPYTAAIRGRRQELVEVHVDDYIDPLKRHVKFDVVTTYDWEGYHKLCSHVPTFIERWVVLTRLYDRVFWMARRSGRIPDGSVDQVEEMERIRSLLYLEIKEWHAHNMPNPRPAYKELSLLQRIELGMEAPPGMTAEMALILHHSASRSLDSYLYHDMLGKGEAYTAKSRKLEGAFGWDYPTRF